MHIAVYLAAFGLMAVFHAIMVIRLRWKFKISMGDGGNEELMRAMRVFGNFIEYVPLGLVLLMGCELVQSPAWYLHLTGGSLVLGRCLHAIGMGKPKNGFNPRVAGMILTLISLVLSSVGVLLFSVYSIPS